MQTSIAGAVVMGAVVGLLASLSQQSNVTTLYTTQAPQLAATAQSGIQPVVARPPTVTPRVHNVMGATMMPSMDTLSQSYGSTSLGSTPLPSTTRSWTLLSCGMALCLATYAIFRRSKDSATNAPLLPMAMAATTGRREAMVGAISATGLMMSGKPAQAATMSLPDDAEPPMILCDSSCVADLEKIPKVKTASGLEYRDIQVGPGPACQDGFQVTFSLVASLPDGRVFINSFEKGKPIDARIGTNSMVQGLDEGISTMKVGGIRRIYCPGDLSYATSLRAAPGQPSVPAGTPVIFDVELLLVPGVEEVEDDFKISF